MTACDSTPSAFCDNLKLSPRKNGNAARPAPAMPSAAAGRLRLWAMYTRIFEQVRPAASFEKRATSHLSRHRSFHFSPVFPQRRLASSSCPASSQRPHCRGDRAPGEAAALVRLPVQRCALRFPLTSAAALCRSSLHSRATPDSATSTPSLPAPRPAAELRHDFPPLPSRHVGAWPLSPHPTTSRASPLPCPPTNHSQEPAYRRTA